MINSEISNSLSKPIGDYPDILMAQNGDRRDLEQGDRCQTTIVQRPKRLRDPDEELERLRKSGVLSPENEGKLDMALENIDSLAVLHSMMSPNIAPDRLRYSKILYAQAMEIKRIYDPSHYVFLHGQDSSLTPVYYFIKELWRKMHPDIDLHQFKPLRPPGVTRSSEVIFTSSLCENLEYEQDLLSCDLFFPNTTPKESALYFLENNKSVKANLYKFINRAIHNIFPAVSCFEESILQEVKAICDQFAGHDLPCGNLFVICISKEAPLEKILYRSHAFAYRCQCHPTKKDLEIADKLQNGILDAQTKCLPIERSEIPQYRIYLPGLQPDSPNREMFKSFLLTPFPKEERKALKQRIRHIVEEMFRYATAQLKNK